MNTKRRLLRRRVLPVLVAGTPGGGGVFAAGATGASVHKLTAQQELSQNWSGYVVQGSAGKDFSTVSGSWVQPSVKASSGTATGYSAAWVGLGGSAQQSQSLEQVGTAADVVNSHATYYAWYELVPSAEQKLNLVVNPGNQISGKATVNATTVIVSLTDHTTGRSVTKTLQMSNPDTSSAEWIAEAPATQTAGGSYGVLPLADFGSVTFSNASATADGHTGSLADPSWRVQEVDMTSAAISPALGLARRFNPSGPETLRSRSPARRPAQSRAMGPPSRSPTRQGERPNRLAGAPARVVPTASIRVAPTAVPGSVAPLAATPTAAATRAAERRDRSPDRQLWSAFDEHVAQA